MLIITILILVFISLTNKLEKKYPIVFFIKIFLLSFEYFYTLDLTNKTLLSLLITIVFFILIIALIYEKMNVKESTDNTIFQIAHEVKNPIAVCKGYLDMLDINNNDNIKEYIPIVKNEMNRALSVMDEFLNLKRLTLSKDLMDLSLLLEDVNETMNIVLKNNEVKLSIPKIDDELIINGDYDKLKQVLINLIKNSYEAQAKNIKLNIKRKNKILKISIVDDGIGISNNDLKKIGTPFYTTKVMGTGMGVSMSKEIAKLHNGNLTYTSEKEHGTTANLILPLKYVF